MADQAQVLRGLMDRYEQSTTTAQTGELRYHAPKLAQTIAITSGKGGVGKTTVSVNLAIQLARLGRRVVLLDADLGTANADVMCNIAATGTLAHVISGRKTLEEVMIDAPGGFRLVPGASGLASVANLSAIERDRLTEQIRRLESQADVLLIDTGAGVGPNTLSFCIAAERVLIVTTPEPTAITDAYAAIKTINSQTVDPDLRLLVNMARDENEARQVSQRIIGVSQRFLNFSPSFAGYIASDSRIPRAVRERVPVAISSPRCKASESLLSLAHKLERHTTISQKEGLGFMKRMTTWLAG
jgi:flagellar biosynthesis protein FlhG